MIATPGTIAGLHVGSTDPIFLCALAVHTSPLRWPHWSPERSPHAGDKRQARHIRYDSAYSICLTVARTASALAALRWQQTWPLFFLGAAAFAVATTGRLRRSGWVVHVLPMGGSHLVLLTAFFVDNGPHLPLWRLPARPDAHRTVPGPRPCPGQRPGGWLGVSPAGRLP